MSKSSEIAKFESRFEKDIVEIAAVTGASGIRAGKAGEEIMWTASIDLIAWKELGGNGNVLIEEVQLEWLADDEDWNASKDILKANLIARLLVRRSGRSMMLVKVLDAAFLDVELENILKEAIKPVFYHDEMLGDFELDRRVKLFEKRITWGSEEGSLHFDWDENLSAMQAALKTAHVLFTDPKQWNRKVRQFAADELIELANDWLQDNDDAEIDEITEEMFIDFITLDSMNVYPEGNFEIFFFDGDIFWGHSITVSGNINGELSSAEIAG